MIRTLALLPLLFATPALAAEIKCEGPFAASATLADIETAFGKDNVKTGEVDGPEGSTMIATTVFPNDPDKQFLVYWWDEEKVERLAGVELTAADTAPGGVKVGMSIDEVQKLNGEPFTLSGFYWDYGGSAGFETGKLSNLPGGCYLNVTFQPSVQELPEGVSEAISGDKEIPSDMKEFSIARPVVESLSIGYPDSSAEGQ